MTTIRHPTAQAGQSPRPTLLKLIAELIGLVLFVGYALMFSVVLPALLLTGAK